MSNHVNDDSAVIALYQNTADEITRYRDLEWKIAIWTITLLFGIITLTKFFIESDCTIQILQYILTFFIIIVTVFSFWYINDCHKNLTINKRFRRQCEMKLSINKYLPKEWKKEPEEIKYTKGILHLIFWGILICFTSVFAIVYVMNLFKYVIVLIVLTNIIYFLWLCYNIKKSIKV